MASLFLIFLAFGVVTFILFLAFLFSRHTNQEVKLAEADEAIATLMEKLDQALAEQETLASRVENLETIVISEAWDALQNDQVLMPPAPLLLLDEPEEPSNAEKAARLARKHRL